MPDPTPSTSPRQVKCPACGGPSLYASENRWRPFCSERCRRVDLGAWASDRYRVPGQPQPNDLPPELGGDDGAH